MDTDYSTFLSGGKKVSFSNNERYQDQMASNGDHFASSPPRTSSHSDIFAKAAELTRALESHNFDLTSAPTSSANLSTMNRENISLSQSIAVDSYRRPSSPPPAVSGVGSHLKQYSQEYVSRMQRNHQDRLSEAVEASSRVLQAKEFEIGELSQKLQVVQERTTALNEEYGRQTAKLMSERDEMLRIAERQKREFEEILDLERHKHSSEMDSMRKHNEQLAREKEELGRFMERLRRECDDAIANEKRQAAHELEMAKRSHEAEIQNTHRRFESEVKRLDQTLLKVKQDAEESTSQRIRTLCDEHERQVAEVQRLLNNESERLTLAREEICELSMSKGKDVMEMKAKLEATQRANIEFREETKIKLDRIVADFSLKDKEYSELVHSLKIQIDLEKQNSKKTVDELSAKARTYEAQSRRMEEKATALHQECDRLNQTLEATQKHTAQQNQQNVEMVEMIRQTQHENGIMRQELMLTETDRKRLRHENTELRAQVEKFDKMIYGKNRNGQ